MKHGHIEIISDAEIPKDSPLSIKINTEYHPPVIAVGSNDESLRIYQPSSQNNGLCQIFAKQVGAPVTEIAWFGKQHVIVGCTDGSLLLIDLEAGIHAHPTELHQMRALIFSIYIAEIEGRRGIVCIDAKGGILVAIGNNLEQKMTIELGVNICDTDYKKGILALTTESFTHFAGSIESLFKSPSHSSLFQAHDKSPLYQYISLLPSLEMLVLSSSSKDLLFYSLSARSSSPYSSKRLQTKGSVTGMSSFSFGNSDILLLSTSDQMMIISRVSQEAGIGENKEVIISRPTEQISCFDLDVSTGLIVAGMGILWCEDEDQIKQYRFGPRVIATKVN